MGSITSYGCSGVDWYIDRAVYVCNNIPEIERVEKTSNNSFAYYFDEKCSWSYLANKIHSGVNKLFPTTSEVMHG